MRGCGMRTERTCRSIGMAALLVVAAALVPSVARGQVGSSECCSRGAAAAQAQRSVARVTLGDGSTLCGPFQYAAAEQVLVVAGKDAEARDTLDFVSLAFVREVRVVA